MTSYVPSGIRPLRPALRPSLRPSRSSTGGVAAPSRAPQSKTEAKTGSTIGVMDLVAFGVITFAGLNLNGIFLLLTRKEGVLSPLVFVAVIALCIRHCRQRIPPMLTFFIFFIALYVTTALIASSAKQEFPMYYITIYTGTFLFVTSISLWLIARQDELFKTALVFFKYILIATCIFTLLSPQLAQYLNYVAAQERASGLFENPNEAATAALYALVLILAFPTGKPAVTLVQIGIAIAALILTFSKNGFLIMFVIFAYYIYEKRSAKLAILFFLIVPSLSVIATTIVATGGIDLYGEQKERFDDILAIFTGNFNARTTTGRTLLWDFGMDRIAHTFPWGGGLGQFHAMEGGFRGTTNGWLGIHNTFLMILGEAGVIPFVLFIVFLVGLCLRSVHTRHRFVAIGFCIVLVFDMTATHGVLGFRLANVVLAFMIAIASQAPARTVPRRRSHAAMDSRPIAVEALAIGSRPPVFNRRVQ